VRYVFHADLPASPEAYYQEIGRAGRDGEAAEAHMLYGQGDIRMRRMFIEQEESNDERKRREHVRLSALVAYCEASSCRRRILLGYFGEEAEPCGNCDVCLTTVALSDATKEARQILEIVVGTGEMYGAMHIVDVLCGAETDKIFTAEHNRLRLYGAGRGRKKEEWRAMIRQLTASGFLHHDAAGYGGLSLTKTGGALLRGEGNFHYRAAPASARKERGTVAPAALGDDDAALLAALKRLRLGLAARRHLPAYLIFSDKTLGEMARARPRNLQEFAMIGGVGNSKLRDFGQIFIDAIAAHGGS
jgi:ATP-dependent DNA helicase RecQ